MTKTTLASSVIAAVLLGSGAASAQSNYVAQGDSPQWLKDRQSNEGEGIQAGDFELHPSIAGEVGYDSNYFVRSSSNAGYANSGPVAPVIPSAEFRITPALYLSTLSGARAEDSQTAALPSVAFRAGVNATYRAFIGLSSAASQEANDVSKQQNVGVNADASLDILPGRPLAANLTASYGRIIQPNTVDADPNQSFTYDTITAGAQLIVQPGSGTLNWHLGYRVSDTIFESDAGSPYNNLTQQANTSGGWAFRPRTQLVYDATVDYQNYQNAAQAQPVSLVTSTPVRARLGITGLVTDRFAVEARAGWGASFFSVAFPREPQYDSVIGHAELKWFLSASPGIASAAQLGLTLSSIAVGYDRNFQSSFLGSYIGTDRGYLKFSYQFAGRAIVSLEGGAAAVESPELFWSDGTSRHTSFTDTRIDATLFGEYRIMSSLGLNLTLRYTQEISDTQLSVLETPPPTGVTVASTEYDLAWKRFEAYLGLRWFL